MIFIFEYEYVEVDAEGFFHSKFREYRKTIDEYAKKGYRFVAAVPTEVNGHGQTLSMDLIFEKQTTKED